MIERIDDYEKKRVHDIVEYIKNSGDFPFGESEVLRDPYAVLSHFDVWEHLSLTEEAMLVDELLKLSEFEDARNALEWARSHFEIDYPCL